MSADSSLDALYESLSQAQRQQDQITQCKREKSERREHVRQVVREFQQSLNEDASIEVKNERARSERLANVLSAIHECEKASDFNRLDRDKLFQNYFRGGYLGPELISRPAFDTAIAEWTALIEGTPCPTDLVRRLWGGDPATQLAAKWFVLIMSVLSGDARGEWIDEKTTKEETAYTMQDVEPSVSALQADPTNEGGRVEKIRNLRPAARKAYFAFKAAELKAERRLEDQEAFDILKEEGIPEGDQGELTDYQLPDKETWCRYLRLARRALGEQKYTRRRGRSHGKSIVEPHEI